MIFNCISSRKANVVADTLGWKLVSMGSLAWLKMFSLLLVRDIQSLANDFLRLQVTSEGEVLSHMEVRSKFFEQIKSRSFEVKRLINLREKMLQGEARKSFLYDEGVLRIQGKLCMPRVGNLISTILSEAHNSKHFIYLGVNKMYRDLR